MYQYLNNIHMLMDDFVLAPQGSVTALHLLRNIFIFISLNKWNLFFYFRTGLVNVFVCGSALSLLTKHLKCYSLKITACGIMLSVLFGPCSVSHSWKLPWLIQHSYTQLNRYDYWFVFLKITLKVLNSFIAVVLMI
jgi:hypothetical protein